jgi:hypothetical protein
LSTVRPARAAQHFLQTLVAGLRFGLLCRRERKSHGDPYSDALANIDHCGAYCRSNRDSDCKAAIAIRSNLYALTKSNR